jgi:hypothetical protein
MNAPVHRNLGEGGKQHELLAACEFYFQGLKARKRIAQGNALGKTPTKLPSPERRQKFQLRGNSFVPKMRDSTSAAMAWRNCAAAAHSRAISDRAAVTRSTSLR